VTPQAGNVFASDVVDRGPWILYDRNTTAASTATPQQYNFFNTTRNNIADSNLQTPGRLSPPQAFSTQSVGFVTASTMLFADWAQLMKLYYHNFFIGTKNFSQGPMQLFPGGAGPSAAFATNHATTAMLQAVNNGDPSLLACRRFPDYPRIIPANVNFGVNVIVGSAVFTTAATVAATIVSPAYGGVDVLAILDGIFDREVQ